MSSQQENQGATEPSSSTTSTSFPESFVPRDITFSIPLYNVEKDTQRHKNRENFFRRLRDNPQWIDTGYSRIASDPEAIWKILIAHPNRSSNGSTTSASAPCECSSPEEAETKTQTAINILLILGFMIDPDHGLVWGGPTIRQIMDRLPNFKLAIEKGEIDVKERYHGNLDRPRRTPDRRWVEYLDGSRKSTI